MYNLSTLLNARKTTKPVTKQLQLSANKIKSKPQASKNVRSKNKTAEVIELQWLQQFVNRKIMLTLLTLTMLFGGVYILPKEDIFPVNKIRVSGNYKQLDMVEIDRYLETFLGRGFFSVDIKSIQQKLNSFPWVETVSVKRLWPNKLQLKITEKQAVARWDNQHLLSSQAVIFTAQANLSQFAHLPRINGYAGQSTELLLRYSQMQQEFLKLGISIAELTEDSKGALSLLINSNLRVNIGSENNDIKIKNLLAVYSRQIKPRINHIKRIDFRYSNGFAIAWKDDYLKLQSEGLAKRGNNNV